MRLREQLRAELCCALAAVQYFTRLPVPAWVGHSQAQLDRATRYFPAVGALVGSLGALVLLGASRWWPPIVAVVLSMAATAMVTGAFHEDGLADSVDGLGGSFDRGRALTIMKDSRIGSFGALALVLLLLLKAVVLGGIAPPQAAILMVCAQVVSRYGSVLLMLTLPYVRDDDASRSKPLAQSISWPTVVVTSAMALLAVLWAGVSAWRGVGFAAVLLWWWRRVLVRRLGGYTGDCLGAAQQLTECAFYLGCCAQL